MDRATERPEHIKETMEFYCSKYELLAFLQDSTGASARSVPADGHLTCRYCGKSKPEVVFRTNCHALGEVIGNRRLLAEDECDTCNKFFGSGIEDHFGKWSLPYRVMSCIRGKRGYPSMEREHLGWRIDSSATGLHIVMREDHQIGSIDEEQKLIELKEFPRDPFIPVAVFKTFVRMAMALMPRTELVNFTAVINWIREKDHTITIDNVCSRILYSRIPKNAPPDTVMAVLFRRHTNELNLPYMVFVLMFGNHVFQVFVPSPQTLQNSDFTATYAPFLFGPDDAHPLSPEIIDLGSTQRVKNEMVPIVFGFESVHSEHTSRHENIAIRAYFIWQAGGSKHGNHLSNWLLAEQEVMAKCYGAIEKS